MHGPNDGLTYKWGVELRDASELARIAAALNGTARKPVAVRHDGFLDHPIALLKYGAPHKVIGAVYGARIDGDHVIANVFITDADALRKIDAGTHELSLGYTCRTDSSGYQRDSEVDHLAIVERARCGATCALRTDAAGSDPCGCTRADKGRYEEPAKSGTVLAATECMCKTHAEMTTGHEDSKLNAKERHALPGKQFAVPSREALPIEDEGHVRDAMACFGDEHFQGPAERKTAFHRIVARAHELGIDPSGFEKKYGGNLDGNTNMDEIQKQLDAARAALVTAEQARDAAITRADAADQRAAAADVAAHGARKDAADEKARADKLLADADQVRADADKVRTDAVDVLAQATKVTNERIAERVALLTAATPLIGKTAEGKAVDLTAMSDDDIKLKTHEHLDGETLDTSKYKDDPKLRSAFIDMHYEQSIKRAQRAGASRADALTTIVKGRVEQAPPPKSKAEQEADAIKAMNDRASTAWNKKS